MADPQAQAQQPNPAPVDPAPAPAAPVELPLQPLARQPRQTRETRIPPPARLAYTRYATAGADDDQIRAKALVDFWKIMTVFGGVAILWILFSTGQCVGRQQSVPSTSMTPSAPVIASPTPSVPVPVATPSAPAPVQPQIIVVPVPQPVQQVAFPPATPAPVTMQPPQVEVRPLTDAERRNEALKERLRQRYGIQ